MCLNCLERYHTIPPDMYVCCNYIEVQFKQDQAVNIPVQLLCSSRMQMVYNFGQSKKEIIA